MSEYFDFNGGIGADIANFLPAQFPAQHHTGEAPGSTQPHAGKTVDGHLGRAVDGNTGRDFPAQPDNAQILDDEGIHTALGGLLDQGNHIVGLFVGNQGVQRQMDGNATDVAIFDRLSQCLRGEVFGALAGIELSAA